ncbi:MAG: cbb3-type cytochrome oxidase assembly protein CcoS [Halioglobus sp.]
MESLYFLIPIALVFCGVAIWLLLWAIDNGQYDDLDKEAWRVLADDDPAPNTGEKKDSAARDGASAKR